MGGLGMVGVCMDMVGVCMDMAGVCHSYGLHGRVRHTPGMAKGRQGYRRHGQGWAWKENSMLHGAGLLFGYMD